MKITKSQLKQIIKEELRRSLKEYAMADDMPEPEEGEEFSCGDRVKYQDNTDLIGTVLRLQSEEPYIASPGKYNKFYRVLWDRNDAYIYARGSDSPRGPSKGSGQATTTDERLLIPTGDRVKCPSEDA